MSAAAQPAPGPRNPLLDLLTAEEVSIPALLAARVERTPEAPFLRWEGRTWSYREGWEEALRFAAWVGAQADRPATRVISFLPNRPEALWAWFGTLAAGATYVPLNRAHRGEILADMIARTGARVLVTDAAGLADLPDLSATAIEVVLTDWEEVRALDPAQPDAPRPGDLAELMYTSGTTGRSKAVELSHNQLCRGAGWVARSLGVGAGDAFHAWLPLFHIAGQVDTVLPTVIGGGSVALYPTFSRSRFWDQVEESGATLFIGFANVARLLYLLPCRSGDAETTLRAGVTGAMPAPLSVDFEARFGVRLHDVYGMTEAEPMILPEPGAATPPGSCGRPNPDLEVIIRDASGERAGPGETGEIVCRPRIPNVLTSGYEGDSGATAEAIRDGWFHSGDLGREDGDGFLYFVDRIKHSIRRRGENISSWELETIVGSAPGVAECCAIGVPSPLGEEDVKVVVVPTAGVEVEPAALHSWCEGRMAAFMVPRYVEVVAALPRADTGKVMKEELRTVDGAWDAEERAGTGAQRRR
ncbi:MAG TPA: AMP-binding protein [Solirubrobacterales bacterium]|nr:AMP-binding protein [Solirubrobacterales bacterium]